MATLDLTVGIDISGAAQKLKELREVAKAAVSGISGDIDATEAFFEALNKKIQDSKKIIKGIAPEIASQKQQIDELNKKISEVERELKNKSSGYLGHVETPEKRKLRSELSSLRKELQQVEEEYNGNIRVLDRYNNKLEDSQRVLKMAQTELKARQKTLKQTETSYVSIRTQITNVRNEMAALDLAGQKNSARYKELQNELGRLGTAYRKVQFEQKALSTGATQWAGIQSTLQGLMGGFAAYQGVLGLVADSSEDLVKIQTRLQSVMGIIMGMTQVSNTLHATSAARMATLTKVTELWNAANLRVGKGLIRMGVAANTARIAAIALNGALTLGIGAAIGIAISAITKMVEKHKEAKKAAEEAAKNQKEAFENYAKSVASNAADTITKFNALQQQYNKLGDSLQAKKKFIKENQEAFKELGVSVNTVNEADNLFINNAEAFRISIEKRARAAAAMKLASEKYEQALVKMVDLDKVGIVANRNESTNWVGRSKWSWNVEGFTKEQNEKLTKLIKSARDRARIALSKAGGGPVSEFMRVMDEAERKAATVYIQKIKEQYQEDVDKLNEEAEKFLNAASLNKKEAADTLKDAGIVTADEQKGAESRAKAEADAQKKLATELANLEFEAEQAVIDTMKEGTEKKLAQIELDYKKREHAINEGEKKLMKALSETEKSPEQIDAAQQMQSQFKGNVDHLSRPLIAAAELVKKGWEDAGDGIATVFSSQYGILDASGKETEILITPILPDGTVLSPQELEDYIFGTLQGAQDILKADDKKLVIATDVSTDGSAGNKYHQLQEVYYNDAIQIAEKIQTKRDANSFKRQSDRYLAISGGKMEIPDLAKEFAEEQAAWDEYLIEYGTFREKLQATKDKYDRLISEAKTDGEKASIEAERDAVVAELEVEMSEWAQGLVDLTLEELTKLTAQTKEQLEDARNAFNKLEFSDSPEAKNYLKIINELSAKLSLLEKKEKSAKKAAKDKDWTKGAQLLNDIASTAREAASALGEFDEGLGKVATFIASMASAAGNLITTIEGVTSAATAAGRSLNAMEKASVILTAISAAFQVMQGLFSLFSGEDAVEKTRREFAELNDEIVRLKRESEIDKWQGTIFGDDGYKNAIENMKVFESAVNRYEDTLDKVRKRGDQKSIWGFQVKIPKTWESAEESIANMQVRTRHATWFRSAKYDSLGNLLPDLFNDDGSLNMEALKKFQESDDQFKKLSEENQGYINDMIADWELYQDALDAVHDYLSDIFGDLGDTMTDALVDAFANGTDAAEAFTESVNSMLRQLAKSMIQSTFLTPLFENAQKQMEGAMSEDLTDEARFAKFAEIMGGLTSDVLAAQDNIFAALEAFDKAAKEKGLDVFASDNSAEAQKASARGFQAMSQDTGDELNGRFTDIQGKVTDIRDYVLQITANGTMQLNEVINIRDIMIQINGNVADIRTNTNVLPDMSAKLDKIIRNTENI